VSPNLYEAVVEEAVSAGVVSAPGCFTPTEAAHAMRMGADIIKLFPCDRVGPRFVYFMQGPCPGVRIMPAGSITIHNMSDYCAAGAFAGVAGVTTEMPLADAVKNRRFAEITECAREWTAAVRRMKSGEAMT
jgi:2-dehydro-3-deoxyphosphogluconate aldolase/(4S)-4-hydroxy-2-oxoglutarate aldolase